MSLYGDLLRAALDAAGDGRDRPVAELVALTVSRRAALAVGGAGRRSGEDLAAAIDDALLYDAVLIQLCQRLGIEHHLTGPSAGPSARRQAERRLAERLPTLAAALEAAAPTGGPAPDGASVTEEEG